MIGAARYDITGPAAELGMLGYAMVDQGTAGIHSRLWARAFVIESPCNGQRLAIVVADLAMVTQALKQEVIRRLQERLGPAYDDAHVLLTATHTHAGPGGYSHYALYNLTILGFDAQNFNAIAEGMVQAIRLAQENMQPGRILIAQGELLGAGFNRAPDAYAQNPAQERARYPRNVDTTMTLLRFQGLDGREIGALNWFPTHGTSMSNRNRLISADNKGYAAYLFEKLKGSDPHSPEGFVAAFAQSNAGDVSPNLPGLPPDDVERTALIGRLQFEKALDLYTSAIRPLRGGIATRHTYLKMDALTVDPQFTDGTSRSTCPAALGVSFLAGTHDGPGYLREGSSCQDVEEFSGWNLICELTTTSCQAEKPIILEMGTARPYPYSPEVLPLQIVRMGDFALAAFPFEMTTMAGRRLREQMEAALATAGVHTVELAALSNAYAGYITTREEYAYQDYEGASNHFGPWSLAALRQGFQSLAQALVQGLPVDPGPTPRDLRCCQHTLQPGVIFDDKPLGVDFGDVKENARPSYQPGETVRVVFWGAHPKNNLRTMDTFLRVERLEGGNWVAVADDNDWETTYRWQREYCPPTLACSLITVEWHIPADIPPGTYRIRHFGDWKSGWDGVIRPYSGASRAFSVR
jgi:neutral ceramidase